jgi:hypothetical protein
MPRAAVLTDLQWSRIELLMPSSEGQRGRPFRDHRQVMEDVPSSVELRWRPGEHQATLAF